MSSLTMSLIGLITSICITIFTLLARRMNMLEERVRSTPDRKEVRQIVDDKMAPVEVLNRELKEDIKEMNRKLDKLLESR